MVTYLLDFYENIRFSKTLSEYPEQSYPLEKTAIVFLDPHKKCKKHSQDIHGTIRGYSYIQYSQKIFSEYSPEFHWEYFPNILGISHGNVPRIFHEHIFARWVQLLSKINIRKNRFENLKRSKHLWIYLFEFRLGLWNWLRKLNC